MKVMNYFMKLNKGHWLVIFETGFRLELIISFVRSLHSRPFPMVTTPDKPSRWIPGRYPEPGTSAIADAIRRRRGERGLTALDGALLHVEPVAEGWNTLLGAVRMKGNVPGDVRELMVRAFKWFSNIK